MHDYQWATTMMGSARSEQAGKPLENNTRLFKVGGEPGGYAIKLHNTFVVEIHPDNTYTLRNGGYATVTTLDRIRTYAPVRQTLFSVKGEWFLRLEPDAKDPRPATVYREVPKPYLANDPGAEPVKNPEGCVAGQLVTTEHVDEVVECWRSHMKDGDELVEVARESASSNNDYDTVKVRRSWNDHVWIGEAGQAYHDEGWMAFTGNNYGNSIHYINDGEAVKYVQCSHCKEFDAIHETWRHRMHGPRWGGRGIDKTRGYAKHAEMIEQYGSLEAWDAAYKADYRARREYLKAEREWDERNRVPFYDGITVNSEGYAPRLRKDGPSPAKLRRHEKLVAKLKQQINTYVDGFVAELKTGTMPMPGPGDCWHCGMYTVEDGKSLGDASGDHDHLLSHMEEKYYVPSLAVNALRERGYKDVGVYIWLDMDPIRPNRDGTGMEGTGTMGKVDGRYDGVKRDIVKYMSKRLIPAAPTK